VVVDEYAMADVGDLFRGESPRDTERDSRVVAGGLLVLNLEGRSARPAPGKPCAGPVRGGASGWDLSGCDEVATTEAGPHPRHRRVGVPLATLLQPGDGNGRVRHDFWSLQTNRCSVDHHAGHPGPPRQNQQCEKGPIPARPRCICVRLKARSIALFAAENQPSGTHFHLNWASLQA
jgi:hypothetical protein